MSFHIGQRVVCVCDQFSSDKRWRRTVRTFPVLNSLYTVREIHVDAQLIGLCFYEIVNPCASFVAGYGEPAFNSHNFRPAKTTSIAMFERLLASPDKTPPLAEPVSNHAFAQILSRAD